MPNIHTVYMYLCCVCIDLALILIVRFRVFSDVEALLG